MIVLSNFTRQECRGVDDMTRILIVEDNVALGQGSALGLRSEMISVHLCRMMAGAKGHLKMNQFSWLF